MPFISKVKMLWNSFCEVLFKRYIQCGEALFEQNKDKELTREIARYYLIERDKQHRFFQRILFLVLLLVGLFFIIGGLYSFLNNIPKAVASDPKSADSTTSTTLIYYIFVIIVGIIYTTIACCKLSNELPLNEKAFRLYGMSFTSALPEVITNKVNIFHIPPIIAEGGGNVISDGGLPLTEKGICWDTSPNPTINNCLGLTQEGTGIGKFVSSINGLNANKQYYVRAYAANRMGVGYGKQKDFNT